MWRYLRSLAIATIVSQGAPLSLSLRCSVSGNATNLRQHQCQCYHVRHTATRCNMLQRTPQNCSLRQQCHVRHTATHYNTLHNTATRCNMLQHAATRCNERHTIAACDSNTTCDTLQHTTTHCITLQHAATCCNTLQHAATNGTPLQLATAIPRATHCNTIGTYHSTNSNANANTHLYIRKHRALQRKDRALQRKERTLDLSHDTRLIHVCDMTHSCV